MLPGKKVDLRIWEKTDIPLVQQWSNDIDFNGEFEPFGQASLQMLEKDFDTPGDSRTFIVQKKDGTPVGYIAYFKSKDCWAIGYMLVPGARGKGYGTDAVQVIVDYIFLHKDTPRIQAETHPENKASQRVLEKAGFTREGLIRKSFFSRGVYRDTALWSILRNEWKKPKVLPLGYVSK